ncbi:MAG TPA: DUF3604 domain-containing protein [Deltaproteobacteria bacterium]|nr:DUF3604 domain-containing protein [Deltaproteobacteria bacterium]
MLCAMATPVDPALVGFADAAVSPTGDPRRLGSVRLEPGGPLEVRSDAVLRLTYTVGHHGLDDRGAFKVVMRFPADGGAWQLENPSEPNHVQITASRPCAFRARFEAYGNARPWFKALTVQVVEGCLREGDTVTLTLSIRLQTFCEEAWELRLLVDPCATQHFVEVPDRLFVEIGPGPVHRWVAVLPTRWPVDQPFRLGIRAEDAYGNPTDRVSGELHLQVEGDVGIDGLPPSIAIKPGARATTLEGLTCSGEGVLRIVVLDEDGQTLCTSNPLRIVEGQLRHVWGDLHGQSGETVGINSAGAYLRFARELAFLDVCSHQGNDFQITNEFWDHLGELIAAANEPGRFVTLLGYEWSGNTAVGGDRNVYFRDEGGPLYRSSHALLLDRSDLDTDCTTAEELFEALAGEDCVIYAHVGGRWADLAFAHDETLERAIEIHSAWGTFEWLLHDAFALGHRVGVVANSDGHKGRPGASHPGAATFGAYGGLTCFSVPELTRDAIFDCIRARRTYGTTGARLELEVTVVLPDGRRLPMGSIAETDRRGIEVEIEVRAAAPIAWVELRRGPEAVHHHRPYGEDTLGQRIGIRWRGARYRGRGRQVRWDGHATITGARFGRVTRINAFNPDHTLEHAPDRLSWQAVTTGNFGGLDVRLQELTPDARLQLHTEHAELSVAVDQLGSEPIEASAGGLDMALSLQRLPDDNPHRHVRIRVPATLLEQGDTPLWACVTLEDGHQAWSSPVYLYRGDKP